MRRVWGPPLIAMLALGLGACDRKPQSSHPQLQAEFGVYFGGQIQERKAVPFELDGAKQSHGFRISYADAPAEAHEVSWQLSPPRFNKPTQRALAPSASPPASAETSGSALMQPGQRELSQVWTFKPGDPLGVWNIRVTVDRRVLIDRPFLVYDAEARSRLNHRADAGR